MTEATAADIIAAAAEHAQVAVVVPPARAWRVITALLFVSALNGALALGAIFTTTSAAKTVHVTKIKGDGGRAALCTALALDGARQTVVIDLPPACADEAVAPLLPPSVCPMFHVQPPNCARDWPHDLRG